MLRLLTPLALPERTRVRIQIMEEETIEDAKQGARGCAARFGLVKPSKPVQDVSERLPGLAAPNWRSYTAVGGPISEEIIAEREEPMIPYYLDSSALDQALRDRSRQSMVGGHCVRPGPTASAAPLLGSASSKCCSRIGSGDVREAYITCSGSRRCSGCPR